MTFVRKGGFPVGATHQLKKHSLGWHAWTVASPVREPYVEDNALQPEKSWW